LFKEIVYTPVAGWKFTVTDPLGSSTMHFTGADGSLWLEGLPPGTYTIVEGLEFDGVAYHPTRTEVNGEKLFPPTPIVEVTGGGKKDANPQYVRFRNKPNVIE
jgi:hypothetical protein